MKKKKKLNWKQVLLLAGVFLASLMLFRHWDAVKAWLVSLFS